MPKTITLVRHAETDANAAGVWQGTADGALSDRGKGQVALLAKRVAGWEPDLVVTSDLQRTRMTSEAFGDAEPDAAFREFAIGSWEGLTSQQVAERYPDQWASFLRWDDMAPGGGERLTDFADRVGSALDRVIDRVPDGGHGVVVAHGGVIWSLLSQVLETNGAAPMTPPNNTSLTRIEVDDDGRKRMITYNDAGHLDRTPVSYAPNGNIATLIRHGQSEGNVSGEWHGITESALTQVGREQAHAAAPYAPTVGPMFSSPLSRAFDTARIIGSVREAVPNVEPGLVEMSFGEWEGLTTAEILARYADEMSVYERGDGDAIPRGVSGESLTGVGERMVSTVASLATRTNGSSFVAVSHGASIRAFALNVLGVANAGRGKVALVRNTAMSSVVLTPDAMLLASYNTGPHLED
ncbi:MAG: histidine phosphatase family protein [Acidimicrobiia bacterium]|nr:histidine phosphatase family protein [Acidimicrobiia bacterium]